MFGVRLSTPALDLLREVETLYGQKVWINGPVEMAAHQEAGSGLSPDGVPCVRFGAHVTPTEELLVHELFHLKLSATGFPYVFTVSQLPQEESENIHFFVAELYDAIEHWIFYPPMRAMGLQPSARHERDVELARVYGYQYGGRSQRAMRALYLFIALLLSEDTHLVERFTQWYEQNNWRDAVATSRRLVEQVRADRPSTADAAISTLVACLNHLELDGMFQVYGNETRKLPRSNVQLIYLSYLPTR